MKLLTEDTMPNDLEPGMRFVSDREEEGNVTVVCAYGHCTHDDRPDSVHVRDGHSHWFNALIENEPVTRIVGIDWS